MIENHRIGDTYILTHIGGKQDTGWKIAYSNFLPGTFKKGIWVVYSEPFVLIEKKISGGIDIRETPWRFITKET